MGIACGIISESRRSRHLGNASESAKTDLMTPLHSTLKRALTIDGRDYVLTLTDTALKLTLKGKRNGVELPWLQLVNGEAALAVALHASLGAFASKEKAPTAAPPPPTAAPSPLKAATRTVAPPTASRPAVKPKRNARRARKTRPARKK